MVARNAVDLSELTAKPEFANKLYDLLRNLEPKNDPLWLISAGVSDAELKRAGVSRSEKSMVRCLPQLFKLMITCFQLVSLHRMIRTCPGLFPDLEIVSGIVDLAAMHLTCTKISNRLLVSTTLAQLPPTHLIPYSLPAIIAALRAELGHLPGRISSFASGLPLFPTFGAATHTEVISLSHIDNCVRLLDFCVAEYWRGNDTALEGDPCDTQSAQDMPAYLSSLCIATDVLCRDDGSHESLQGTFFYEGAVLNPH